MSPFPLNPPTPLPTAPESGSHCGLRNIVLDDLSLDEAMQLSQCNSRCSQPRLS